MTKKDQFLKLLSALESQYRKDQLVQERLEKLYGEESNIPMHNVDALVVPVVETMSELVPMESNKAMEEIFDYMYALDFGSIKTTDGAYIRDGEDLWNVLNVENIVSNAKKQIQKQ